MADISGLKLKDLDAVDWEQYPPGGGVRKRPQNPGVYEAKAPALSEIKFDAQDGYLRFVNKATIIGGDPTRDEVIFDYVTNKPYQRGKRKGASRMGDFLLAVGTDRADLPQGKDHGPWADAVEAAADGVFAFLLDWDAYDSESERSVAESSEDFPDDPEHPGEKLPYMVVKRADGSEKRIPARQRIRFYRFEREE